MKRYLEQLQDEIDQEAIEYTPITNNNGNRKSLPSLVIQKLRSVFR